MFVWFSSSLSQLEQHVSSPLILPLPPPLSSQPKLRRTLRREMAGAGEEALKQAVLDAWEALSAQERAPYEDRAAGTSSHT